MDWHLILDLVGTAAAITPILVPPPKTKRRHFRIAVQVLLALILSTLLVENLSEHREAQHLQTEILDTLRNNGTRTSFMCADDIYQQVEPNSPPSRQLFDQAVEHMLDQDITRKFLDITKPEDSAVTGCWAYGLIQK